MSAYSPTLPRTADLRGADRLLVLVGSALTELGRRRAAARAHALDARRRSLAPGGSVAARDAMVERTRDRAAASRVSLLP